MEAIRQFVTVKDHQINITLPDDFDAEEVEVIILRSSKDKEFEIPQWQMDEVRERTERYLKDPSSAQDIDDFLEDDDFELTDEMKAILDERANEPTDDYLTAEESLTRIRKRYGL